METEETSIDVGGQGKIGKWENVKTGGNEMKNVKGARRIGNKEKLNRRAKKAKNFQVFTSNYTLCSVGNVIQGDVCPHVSTHLGLKGHSEGYRAGHDDISVCPLSAMVSSGCPHQQTGTAGSNSKDLVRSGGTKWHFHLMCNNMFEWEHVSSPYKIYYNQTNNIKKVSFSVFKHFSFSGDRVFTHHRYVQ